MVGGPFTKKGGRYAFEHVALEVPNSGAFLYWTGSMTGGSPRERLLTALRSGDVSPGTDRTEIPVGGRPHLSMAQKELWRRAAVDANQTITLGVSILIEGELDEAALRQAIRDIAKRHAPLRSRVVAIDGRPQVNLGDPGMVTLKTIDIEDWSGTTTEQGFVRHFEEGLARKFRYDGSPLVSMELLRRSRSSYALFLFADHIVMDGWSFGLFMSEVAHAYNARRRGEIVDSSELCPSYYDLANWERSQSSLGARRAEITHWAEVLHSPPPAILLPATRERSWPQPYRRERIDLRVRTTLYDDVSDAARDQRVSAFAILLAAFNLFVISETGVDDVCLIGGSANRPTPESFGMIGLFATISLLRTRLSDDMTIREVVERSAVAARSMSKYAGTPFRKVIQWTRRWHDLGARPAYTLAFVYQNYPMPAFSFDDLEVCIGSIDFGAGGIMDLNVVIVPNENEYFCPVTFNGELFDREAVAGYLAKYWHMVGVMTKSFGRRVGDLRREFRVAARSEPDVVQVVK